MLLPAAHVGHFLWILYLVPVVIVIVSILVQLRRDHDDNREDES